MRNFFSNNIIFKIIEVLKAMNVTAFRSSQVRSDNLKKLRGTSFPIPPLSGKLPHGCGESGESRRPRPGQHRLMLGLWNITTLEGKDSDLVQEIECYQLDVVWLTSTQII